MNIILPMLTVLFVGLKLTGHIDWSWWLITLPMWGGIVFMFALGFLYSLIGAMLNWPFKDDKKKG